MHLWAMEGLDGAKLGTMVEHMGHDLDISRHIYSDVMKSITIYEDVIQ